MKEKYLAGLNVLEQGVALNLQQYENAPAATRQSDRYKKLEQFKIGIDLSIKLLHMQKSDINNPGIRDRVPLYENQIVKFLSSNRKEIPPWPVQRQLPTRLPMSQIIQHDGHINQVQQMSLQGSGMSSMQPDASNIPASQLGFPVNQQSISNMMQIGNNPDQTQFNTFGAFQGTLPNSLNAGVVRQNNNNHSYLSQDSISVLQNNAGVMPQGHSMVQQPQHLMQQSQHQTGQSLQQPGHQQINEMNGMKSRGASKTKARMQHGLLSAHPKAGTPLQSSNSPLVALSNTDTPRISATHPLAEFVSRDGNAPTVISSKSATTNRSIDRLINALQSSSPCVLKSFVNDIESVVSMIDRFPGSSREDLAVTTKFCMLARNFMSQDGGASTKKRNRDICVMPLNVVSSEQESAVTSNNKRQKFEVSRALLEEIREINQRLIETEVIISNEDVANLFASVAGGEGILVKFSFNAVACSPDLKSHFAYAHMSPIMSLRLLLPVDYPKSLPVVIDKFPADKLSELSEDLLAKAKSTFNESLRALSQPMLLKDMAKAWNVCARKVIVKYAEQMGGGSFSSRYGAWEIMNA